MARCTAWWSAAAARQGQEYPAAGRDMIIEFIFSTIGVDGQPNFAPMGVVWGEETITVRPFRQTKTYENLITSGYGVVSLTDDVRAFVRCGLYHEILPHFAAKQVPGVVYQGACAWRELQVVSQGGDEQRAEIRCRVVEKGYQREFIGFCRARTAVLEAAILATRLHLLDVEWIHARLDEYETIVEKTGDENERLAFQEILQYIRS